MYFQGFCGHEFHCFPPGVAVSNNVIVIECIHWGYGLYSGMSLLSPIYQLFIISFLFELISLYTLPLLPQPSFCAGV